MKALVHKGNSANIDYYGEPGPEGPGRIWCQVLCSAFIWGPHGAEVAPIPDYHVTVYETGTGEIERFTYRPKTTPRPQVLSERTVTRIVRAHLRVSA